MCKRTWMLALLLLTMVGCGRFKVNSAEVVGTWKIKESSRRNLPTSLRNGFPEITLKPDGTFDAVDMPGLLYSVNTSMLLDSGSGTWKLLDWNGEQDVQLGFQKITSGSIKRPLPYGTQIVASKSWSTVDLEYFVGDQDQGIRIELERK